MIRWMSSFEPLAFISRLRAPGIRGRLALTFGCLSVLLSLGLALIVGNASKAQLQAQSGRMLSDLAYQMANRLDRGMFEHVRRIQYLGVLSRDRLTSAEQARLLFAQVRQAYPEYARFGVTDARGRVLLDTSGLLDGQDRSMAPWFRGARLAPYVADSREGSSPGGVPPVAQGAKLVDLAVPMKDAQGRANGVLVTFLGTRWAEEVRDSLLRGRHDLEMFVISREGHVLLGPPAAKAPDRELLERMRTSRQGFQVVEAPQETYLTGYALSEGHRSYPGLDWLIVVRQDAEIAFADSLALQRQIVLWGLAMGAAFSLWGLLIAGHLAAPIRALAAAADRVRQGERELQLPAFHIREFATLAHSLSNMVATLTAQEHELREAKDGLERRVEERTRELRHTEARLREAAYRDSLTGLPNRLMFQEQLRQAMAYATQYDRKLALMFLDLDRFKAINDTLGHDAGDLLLKRVAEALSGTIRGGDLVARLAGDEFTLILSDVEDADDVRVVAERIVSTLSRPFDLNGTQVQTGASVGIALFPNDGTDVAALLKKADVAMYLAKRQQAGYQFYAEAFELAKG